MSPFSTRTLHITPDVSLRNIFQCDHTYVKTKCCLSSFFGITGVVVEDGFSLLVVSQGLSPVKFLVIDLGLFEIEPPYKFEAADYRWQNYGSGLFQTIYTFSVSKSKSALLQHELSFRFSFPACWHHLHRVSSHPILSLVVGRC